MSEDITPPALPQEGAPETTPPTPPQENDLSKTSGVDYKAELAKAIEEANQRALKAEQKVIRLKRKIKSTRDGADDDDEDDDQQPYTPPTPPPQVDLEEQAEKVLQLATRKQEIRNLISTHTNNPDEQQLIALHLDTLKPSGDLAKDVRRAVLLANEGFYTKLHEERQARTVSHDGTTTTSSSSVKPVGEVPEKEDAKHKAMVERFQQNLPPRYRKKFTK